MARNKRDAQPALKLTDDEWIALHQSINEDKSTSVAKHCEQAGISRQRYYFMLPRIRELIKEKGSGADTRGAA